MALDRKKSFDWKENPLILAAIISLASHLAIYGGWKLGNRFEWWKNQPAWLQKLSSFLSKPPTPKKFPQPQNQVPLIFVDVDPQSSVKEPPKDAKFYGAANSKAASEKEKAAELPEILGKQDKVIKATENSPSKAQPLQPSPPKPETEAKESKPKEKQIPGDLALAKPQDENKKTEGEEEKEHVRPRKLSDVKPSLLGEKMKQPGGAKRLALSPAFDVKATSFGDYDRQFIEAVQHRWYELLEGRNTVPGRIVLEFRLNYDGRITDLKLVENTTQSPLLELICKGAIDDPSPYRKWPSEMRREMKSDSREVRFTFYYE